MQAPTLRALPTFEVIVIDDGSAASAPDFIRQWPSRLDLRLIRQDHAGISAARNRGIQASSGALLLFVDADCRLEADCIDALLAAAAEAPSYDYFQLHLVGDCSTLTGRVEHLRVLTLQNHLLQADGSIRYLNTAGFALRRRCLPTGGDLFNPAVPRGEDTLLLSELMNRRQLPLFVPAATVRHQVSLSVLGSFRKDFKSAMLEAPAYALISAKAARVRMSHKERLSLLRSMWKAAADPCVGRGSWFVLVARQALQRVISYICALL